MLKRKEWGYIPKKGKLSESMNDFKKSDFARTSRSKMVNYSTTGFSNVLNNYSTIKIEFIKNKFIK